MAARDARLYVCSARVELTIPGALTLKDRRAVVKSLVARLSALFNLSVSDLDGGGGGAARAILGIAAASGSASLAREAVHKAVAFIEEDGRAEVQSAEIAEL